MRKQVSLQRSITLSVLSIGLLSGAFGLAYAYWQTKLSFREAIGLGFQELARQSADKVGLILEKEIEWVERLSSLPQVREAVREGTRLTFDQQVLERWKESQRPYFRSLEILCLPRVCTLSRRTFMNNAGYALLPVSFSFGCCTMQVFMASCR
jgi:hypothetical protein